MDKKKNYFRNDRKAELNQLESVIEKKKLEIQARLEAEKKKETEEALKKIQEKPAPRRNLWIKDKPSQKNEQPAENVFSNDGSFLEQFRKLAKSGLKPEKIDRETLAKACEAEEREKERKKAVEEEKHQRQLEREIRERERDFKKLIYGKSHEQIRIEDVRKEETPSLKRTSLDVSSVKVNLPPPGVVQFVPQVQVVTPMVIAPVTQLILNHPQQPPAFTTNEIQLQAAGLLSRGTVPQFSNASSPVPPLVTHVSGIPTPQPMAPQTIPPPEPLHVEAIPPPPSPPNDADLSDTPSHKRRKKESYPTCEPIGSEIPVPPANDSGRDDCDVEPAIRHLAKMVATSGDHAEEILRVAHADDPTLRFLFDRDAFEYRQFRQCVEAYRNGNLVDSETTSKVDSDDGSADEKAKYDPNDADSSDSDTDVRVKKSRNKYDSPEANVDSNESQPMTRVGESFLGGINDKPTGLGKASPGKADVFEDIAERPSFSGSTESSDNSGKVTFVKAEKKERKRKSRWGDKSEIAPTGVAVPAVLGMPVQPSLQQLPHAILPIPSVPGSSTMLTQVTRKDPGLLAYARQTFGSLNLSEDDWKRAEDHYKVSLLYQDVLKKRAELDKLARAGKFKYEYDSDEETEGGTWEHKLRNQEMMATQLWADELTRQAEGKHHIGDFLPPDELKKFMEKYDAVKKGRDPDLSDYKEFKLQEDNVGYQLLQKMGWSEGQGLGQLNQGIVNPVNKASNRTENQGLGLERPDGFDVADDEYDAYRKRMMLAYRFRPNPLNNPRRAYY